MEPPSSPDERLFPQEAGPEGCASGECLPEAEPAEDDAPSSPPPAAPKPVLGGVEGPAGDEARWRAAVDAVRAESPRLGASLSHARFFGLTEDGVRIAFPSSAAFHRATVFGLSRVTLETALAKVFGKKLRLVEETNAAVLEAAPKKSIAEEETSVRQTRERSIEAKVREHPAVKSLAKMLGGTVEHIQVLEPAPKDLAPKEGVEDDG